MTRQISVFGDSISTFKDAIPTINRCFYYPDNGQITGVENVEDTWWMHVIEALDGIFLANGSYSGSMIEGSGFPAGSSAERTRQVLGANGETPTDILIFYGINDYGWGGAQAQAMGRGTNVPVWFDLLGYPEAEASIAPDNCVELFEEAYGQMLDGLRSVAPHANIHCITLIPGRMAGKDHSDFCYALRGKPLDEYNEAIAHAAASRNCDLVDIRSFGYDYQSADGTHPDKVGMKQLAAMIVAAMQGLESPLQLGDEIFGTPLCDLFPESMKSDRFCFKPHCIGCEYATRTGNKWSLVCNKPYE